MLFNKLRKNSTKDFTNSIISKSKKITKTKSRAKTGGSRYEKVMGICDLVKKRLGHLKDQFICITTEEELKNYIDKAIENNVISIDTETTGLDPITDEIVGACIFTPNLPAAYIPINHLSLITNIRLKNQLTNNQVAVQFNRLKNTRIIMFNAKFDIRVIRHQLGVDLPCYWDASIASRILKENEEEGNLKYLWKKYCSPDKEAEHFTFEKMFQGYCFNIFPIDVAYLYAAKDAIMTYELYKFQEPYLDKDNQICKDCGFEKLSYVFREIEMPIVSFVADIEDHGIALDLEYTRVLSEKYHKLLDEKINNFNSAVSAYKDQIIQYRNTHPNCKIELPINISSPVQLAELFYDILQVNPVSRKQPRGTGEEILTKLDHPLCKPILEYRGVNKLITTYIDKMPEILNKKTNKVHCNFRQIGTDTGRFSSNNPNLQNIPSHNSDIRPMFVASSEYKYLISKKMEFFPHDKIKTVVGEKNAVDLIITDTLITKTGILLPLCNIERVNNKIFIEVDNKSENIDYLSVSRIYILLGGDFSQQEPKITADLSNDETFIQNCASGKDAYAIIASIAYEKPYEECLEFYLDENGNKTNKVNKEGKERRSRAKIILLGICYGKTIESIAADMNVTVEKAQEIYDGVMKSIPGLKHLMDESQECARLNGWVETKYGRRRHIPDMQLQPFEVTTIGTTNFDPFFDSEELGVVNDTDIKINQYLQELYKAKYHKQKQTIKERALKEGFKIKDNTRLIEDARRQCVNSRIQGSAADQTKIAMQNIYNNQRLRELGWQTLLLVHDEIIGQCPLENAKECSKIFVQCMLDSAKDLRTGAKCDCTAVFCWYGDEIDIENLSVDELYEKYNTYKETRLDKLKGE